MQIAKRQLQKKTKTIISTEENATQVGEISECKEKKNVHIKTKTSETKVSRWYKAALHLTSAQDIRWKLQLSGGPGQSETWIFICPDQALKKIKSGFQLISTRHFVKHMMLFKSAFQMLCKWSSSLNIQLHHIHQWACLPNQAISYAPICNTVHSSLSIVILIFFSIGKSSEYLRNFKFIKKIRLDSEELYPPTQILMLAVHFACNRLDQAMAMLNAEF